MALWQKNPENLAKVLETKSAFVPHPHDVFNDNPNLSCSKFFKNTTEFWNLACSYSVFIQFPEEMNARVTRKQKTWPWEASWSKGWSVVRRAVTNLTPTYIHIVLSGSSCTFIESDIWMVKSLLQEQTIFKVRSRESLRVVALYVLHTWLDGILDRAEMASTAAARQSSKVRFVHLCV